MGKAKTGRVDSDYSGQPLGPLTSEQLAAADMWSVPAPGLGVILADGTKAITGPGGKAYYRHFEGNRPIFDRPVPAELLK